MRVHQQSRFQSSLTNLAESRVLMLHVSFPSIGLQWPGVRADIVRADILRCEVTLESWFFSVKGH